MGLRYLSIGLCNLDSPWRDECFFSRIQCDPRRRHPFLQRIEGCFIQNCKSLAFNNPVELLYQYVPNGAGDPEREGFTNWKDDIPVDRHGVDQVAALDPDQLLVVC